MNTKKLYQDDGYLKECQATVLSVQGQVIVLDQTVFFPTSGGQSCDLGFLNETQVTDVYEKEGVICHQVANPTGFAAGDCVTCRIDWDRRFDNMQRHCGEHILSGIFFREFGGVNRGFHMGEDYMTIDIRLEEDTNYTEITPEMAQKAELCANQVIWSNVPVTVMRFDERSGAEKMPLRKALAIDEGISVVCVGDPNNAADCVACCGTHPSTSGQVGLLKIYRVEHNKGMFRVYFESGKRALADYAKKHEIIRTLGNQYSAAPDQLLDKIRTQQLKAKEVKDSLYHLKKSVISQRIDTLRPQVNTNAIITAEYDDLKIDDLLLIGRPLIPDIQKLLLLVSPETYTLLLFSNGTVDCGKLVKENASIYNGKGGGNATSARAIFSKREYLDTFMDLIEKHLRGH